MTRQTSARIAGFTYLFYIATALPAMLLFERAARADGIAARLAAIGQHATDVRLVVLLLVLDCVVALVLAVGLTGSRATRITTSRCWLQLPRRRGSGRGDSRPRDARAAVARDLGSREAMTMRWSAHALAGSC